MHRAGSGEGRNVAMAKSNYRRLIVKLSGEALSGPEKFGIHRATIDRFAADLVNVHLSLIHI